MKKDNRGLSLVELLVAIAITAIIAGSITYFLRTSLVLYGNETTDVALQQELQVTLNQIMDYAMESLEVVVSGDGTVTDYIALGKINNDELEAQIIWFEKDDDNPSLGKLYLKKELIDEINKETEDGTLPDTIETAITTASASKENYLLAEYVSSFNVSANGIIAGTNEYENPISLDISIKFIKKGSTKDIEKEVSDKALLRNKIKLPIFVNGSKYTLKKESAEVETVTEYVQVKQSLYGDIHYVQSGGSSSAKNKITVIEIIPKPSLSLLSYLIGGKEPIGTDGMDACVNKIVGKNAGPQWGNESPGNINKNGQILTNNYSGGASIPNFFIREGATYNGYFEKVSSDSRNGRGGVYALNKDDSNYNAVDGENNPKELFVDGVTFISEYSDYYNSTSAYSKSDFCWVWKEDNTVSQEGFYNSYDGSFSNSFKMNDVSNASDGSKLYVIGCKKNTIINNELFILYCMGQDLSEGRYGLCEGINWDGQINYFAANSLAVRRLNKDNIELLSYTPEELRNHEGDLKRADVIFFLSEDAGIYTQAANLLNIEEPDKVDTSTNYYYQGDITFDEAKYIYNQVISYKLGIIVSRPTYNYISASVAETINQSKNENRPYNGQLEPKYKNMNNLFFALYGIENPNIVYSDERVYGMDENRYYIKDQQKVKDLVATLGSKAYLFSGRMMFSDFYNSNYSNKTAYSYENFVTNKKITDDNREYYIATDFIHYKENSGDSNQSGSIGDITLGPEYRYKNASWWDNVYKQWKGQVIANSGDFNMATDRNNNRILDFLFKDYYADLGFRFVSGDNIGRFANQAMIESNGQVVKFDRYTSSGSLEWIGSVVACTDGVMANHFDNPDKDDDSLGTIELVGYAVGNNVYDGSPNRDDGRYDLPDNHESMTYEECKAAGMHYQHEFENLANNKGKALYLSYEELEQAKEDDNGVFIYMIVRSSKEFYPTLQNDNELNPYVYYDTHQDMNLSNPPKSPKPCEIWVSEGWPPGSGKTPAPNEAVKYKGGSGEKEQYVVEFRAHIPASYFRGGDGEFFPPTNYGNNRMIARIGISEGEPIYLNYEKSKEIAGSEVFYIAVRDLFDLD